MRWRKARSSDNVIDARGRGGRRGGGKLTLGGVAIVVVVGLLMGEDPMQILGKLAGQALTQQSAPSAAITGSNEEVAFVKAILGDTEDTWQALFSASGQRYPEPKLVLFSGQVQSACGFASAAVGPFYCPGDRRVYLDLQFFNEMATRFRAAGDFAQAYVIAHEVGHHVQTVLGISSKVQQARQRGQRVEGDNGLLVRQELQADCFAGVWAHHAQARHQWLEPGDIDEALNAAHAIGDDTLQRQAQGRVVPDAFTHGTAAQRQRWFGQGFQHGQPSQCDTFSAQRL